MKNLKLIPKIENHLINPIPFETTHFSFKCLRRDLMKRVVEWNKTRCEDYIYIHRLPVTRQALPG